MSAGVSERSSERVQVGARKSADGSLLELVIDVPKGNVLSAAVMRELDDALAAHAEDTHLKVALIRGAGKHFSFGASVEEHKKDQAATMLGTFHALIRRVAKYPVTVVAAVDGKCLGGAFELALACHLVVATPSACFACPEIKLGVIPPVLAAIGACRLGAATAERMLLTGGDLEACAAHAIGFVSEIVPEGTALEVWLPGWFDKTFAPLSAFALRQGVAMVRRAMVATLDQAIADAERHYVERIVPSHDGNEGIEAFLAKRAPAWKDA